MDKKRIEKNFDFINYNISEQKSSWKVIENSYKNKLLLKNLSNELSELDAIAGIIFHTKVKLLTDVSNSDFSLKYKLDIFYKCTNITTDLYRLYFFTLKDKNDINCNIKITVEDIKVKSLILDFNISYLLGEYILILKKDYTKELHKIAEWKKIIQIQ